MLSVPFLLTVLLMPALAQTAPTNLIFSGKGFNTGPYPVAVVSGDFNQDGNVDLAVIDSQSNAVQLLRNDGRGQFSLGTQTNTGMEPVQVVTGIFDRAGHQDLAVANAGDKTMTVLLGKGDGAFTAKSFPLSGVPSAMIGTNLLNNGLTQLAAVECASTGTAPCWLNLYQSNSQASFFRSQTIPLPSPAGLIASDDFNLDGKPDLAVATDKRVLIFSDISRFDGTGSARVALRSTISPPKTAFVSALVSGHFNAGAAPDLAIEVYDDVNDTNFPNSDYVYLNNGFGSFFLKQKVPGSGGFGHLLAVSDINGDGIQDLLQLGSSLKNPRPLVRLGPSRWHIPGFSECGGVFPVRDQQRNDRPGSLPKWIFLLPPRGA